MKMIPIQRNGSQQLMKVIRSNPNTGRPNQVLRVLPANKTGLVSNVPGNKVPIQKTIILSKEASVLHQSQQQYNQSIAGNVINNGNTGTPKLVFLQPSLQPEHITQQQTSQQNLQNPNLVPYSSEGVILI